MLFGVFGKVAADYDNPGYHNTIDQLLSGNLFCDKSRSLETKLPFAEPSLGPVGLWWGLPDVAIGTAGKSRVSTLT